MKWWSIEWGSVNESSNKSVSEWVKNGVGAESLVMSVSFEARVLAG